MKAAMVALPCHWRFYRLLPKPKAVETSFSDVMLPCLASGKAIPAPGGPTYM